MLSENPISLKLEFQAGRDTPGILDIKAALPQYYTTGLIGITIEAANSLKHKIEV